MRRKADKRWGYGAWAEEMPVETNVSIASLLDDGWEIVPRQTWWYIESMHRLLGSGGVRRVKLSDDDTDRARKDAKWYISYSAPCVYFAKSPVPGIRIATMCDAADRVVDAMPRAKSLKRVWVLRRIIRKLKTMDTDQQLAWLAEQAFLNDDCWY